jgi:F-type H+-transporting ATPase subunit delta
MNNPRLAGRYAKSLLDLAQERNDVNPVCDDMKWLQAVCKSNEDFVAVLLSPIIKADKKQAIVEAVTNGRVSNLTAAFIKLLISKNREANLPEIVNSFVDLFNVANDIQKVKITTATTLTDDLKQAILANITAAIPGKKLAIETLVNDELIGGFTIETNGKLVDASIARDLKDIQRQFLNNDFVHKIR